MIKQKFILIIGGGHLGYYLAKALLSAGNEIVIVERDKTTADNLLQELKDCVVVGDATEISVLDNAGAGRADIVVTTTGYDEDNFTIAIIAKKRFGVPKTVARLRDPNNEAIFKKFGIDETVCSTSVILNLLEQQIDSQAIIPITALDKGNIEVVELKLDEYSPAIGVLIRDLGLPEGNLIISIIRGETSIIPKANSLLAVDDELILLIPKGTSAEIQKYFISSEERY